MIPAVLPPLTGLSVLVTRPQPQAASLIERIGAAGGEAYSYPVIEIERLAGSHAIRIDTPAYDCAIFLSVNAVRHGLESLPKDVPKRIAAIGRTTAEALTAGGCRVDIVPANGFDSEALLRELETRIVAQQRVLLVKGAGGRELLYERLRERGVEVDVLEVYRRVRPAIDIGRQQELESYWAGEGVGIVTLTSAEVLANLHALLSDQGKQLLRTTPFLTVSERIERIAREMGMQGESVLARADEDALLGALALWHARARSGQQSGTQLQSGSDV